MNHGLPACPLRIILKNSVPVCTVRMMEGLRVMKRISLLLVFFLVPLSTLAMTPLTDAQLSEVCSQAGININPDITMNISFGVLAWGDADGLEPGLGNPWGIDTAGGYIGIADFHMDNVRVRLRTDPDDHYGGYDAATMCKPMTIDVGTHAGDGADQSSVRIGAGALQLSMDALQFAVELGANP